MKNAAIYVRVSTQEQKKHGLSVDSQILALKEYCKENGYHISGIYNDAGISARKRYTRRPALLQLLNDCQNKKIDIILFTKLDRWFRSVADYYEVQKILDENKIPWRAIWEDYETETSSGIFKVNIMLSVSQSEADRASERIKSAMDYKRQRGDYLGAAPFGYKVSNGRELIKDENERPAMEAFFNEYLLSFSISKAVRKAYEYGLKLNRTHMNHLIKNPVYYGETKQGYKCEPYITKEQHDLIVETIKKNAREPKIERVYIFSGLCYCAYCGKRMPGKTVVRTRKDGSKAYHMRYVCKNYADMKYRCPSLLISETVLEKYLLDKMDSIIQDRQILIESINSKDNSKNGYKLKSDLENKLKRLTELYTDGDISKDDYIQKRDSIKNEIDAIILEPIPVPKTLPGNWKEIYNELDRDHKRSFWLGTIKKITISNENKKNLDIELL